MFTFRLQNPDGTPADKPTFETNHLRRRNRGQPLYVRDQQRERDLRRRNLSPAEMAAALEDGQYDARPVGPLRHSAPVRNAVLRVS